MARVLFADRVRGPLRGRVSRKRVRQHPIPRPGRLGGTGDAVGAALRRATVKWTSWSFLAIVGSLLFLALYLKDTEIREGVDRLSHFQLSPHS